MRRLLRPFLPSTLVTQLIVLTAAAVLLSTFALAFWFTATQSRNLRTEMLDRLLDRTASAATLLAAIPPEERAQAARTIGGGPWHFRLIKHVPATEPMNAAEQAMAERLAALMPMDRPAGPVIVKFTKLTRPPPPEDGMPHHMELARHMPPRQVVEVTLPVAQGVRLLAIYEMHDPGFWHWPFLLTVLVSAMTASAVAAFAARQVTRPLAKLTSAATIVSRGGDAPRVPEEGPEDVRRAAEAFNAMTDQVSRVMESQRQLLSAVGHDLRTPITAMRISTEFIADEEVRERIEKNLDELHALTEAVLSAARGAGWEKRRRVDLSALVESVCADLEDMGQPVDFHAGPALPILCRSNEIRRAVRNLLENAITYGKAAHVHIETGANDVAIVIEDDGPGIPDSELARVFEPFVRLEGSRSSETGGVGLGLTLVKTIAEGHGGSVVLENRAEGGLRAVLRLPHEAGNA